jgi:hypothetical protein
MADEKEEYYSRSIENWQSKGLGERLVRLQKNEIHFIHVITPVGCSIGVVTSVRDYTHGFVSGVVFDAEGAPSSDRREDVENHPISERFRAEYGLDLTEPGTWHWAEDHNGK